VIIFFVYFLLFFLQFIIFPFSLSPFEIPKVITAQLLIEVLLIIFIMKNKIDVSLSWRKPITIACISIMCISILLLLFFHTTTLLWGNEYRLQGIFLLFHLILFSFISSNVSLGNQHYFKRMLLFVFSLFLLVSIVFGTDTNGRFIGSLGEPNNLASAMICLWPWVFFIQKDKVRLWMKLYSVSGALLILFLAQSRAGIIAFILQLLYIFLTTFTKANRYLIVGLCLSIVVLVITSTYVTGSNVLYESRTEVWKTAFVGGFAHPLLGSGIGAIQQTIHTTSLHLPNIISSEIWDSSHNFLLDWWLQTGILGVLSILTIIIGTLIQFIRHEDNFKVVLMLGLLTVMSFNPMSVFILVAFWWIIGQGIKQQ